MKIKLICVGGTGKQFLKEGEMHYIDRLKHYISFERIEIPDIKQAKNLSQSQIKQKEGEQILTKISSNENVYLLDEKGKSYNSVVFAEFLQKQFNRGGQSIVFIIGGPYGFSDEVYKRSIGLVSLSKMTFSHQMIRIFFIEQLYRAMTILKGEPYHHK